MKKHGVKKFLFLLIITLILKIFMPNVIAYADLENYAEAVVEVQSGRVLYTNCEDKKLPMASTTKVVTCIAVIENFDLNTVIEITPEYVGIEGSSIYVKVGERFTARELLYGLMLRSGNDAAVALAIGLGGSIQSFCGLMQEVALKAGAKNSSFKNPHGLDQEGHYTTALDLALISRYAMLNETFKKIVSTKKITVGSGESTRVFYNKNKLLSNYSYATGIKTGYTKKSGRCLVSSANKNGFELVCVVLNCGPMYERSEKLLEDAYSKYIYYPVLTYGECVGTAKTSKGQTLPCYVANNVYYPLKQSEINSLKRVIKTSKIVKIPTQFNKECGTIEIYLEKQLLFTEKIYTILE